MTNDSSVYVPSQDIVDAAHVPDYDALRADALRCTIYSCLVNGL